MTPDAPSAREGSTRAELIVSEEDAAWLGARAATARRPFPYAYQINPDRYLLQLQSVPDAGKLALPSSPWRCLGATKEIPAAFGDKRCTIAGRLLRSLSNVLLRARHVPPTALVSECLPC